MSGTARLSVVVVAYGHPDHLARCLEPLVGLHRLLVIDNSSDRECELVAAAAGAEYHDPGRNLGFAAALNRALDLLGPGGDILLLNPDAVVDAPVVAQLWSCLHEPANDRVAAAAPRQLGRDGQESRVCWPLPSPPVTWATALGLGRLVRGRNFLIGSVLLLSGAAIAEVGRFDERFFLYAEEADWQRRAYSLGWTVDLCEEVFAYHAGGGSSTNPLTRELLFHSSAELFLRKWYGRLGWTSARLATIFGALARAVGTRGDDQQLALRRARLYLQGPVRTATSALTR